MKSLKILAKNIINGSNKKTDVTALVKKLKNYEGWRVQNIDKPRNLITLAKKNIVITFSDTGYNAADIDKKYDTVADDSKFEVKNIEDIKSILRKLSKFM